jgi:hypothetical protein
MSKVVFIPERGNQHKREVTAYFLNPVRLMQRDI